MPLTKSRRRGSSEVRYNHLDALGGIKLKAYVATKGASGAAIQDRMSRVDAFNGLIAPSSQPPSCWADATADRTRPAARATSEPARKSVATSSQSGRLAG